MQDEALTVARIMIVDDQESNVRLLERILQRAGYSDLILVTNPREVLTRFAERDPDLLLLDLHMPHPDGFVVMEQLRPLIPQGTYLPILAITADATAETKRRALSGGAKDFLTKPFDAFEVLLRIRNLLETRYLYLQLQIRAFLIADIRGYTRLAERWGDEAAATVATRFARLAREVAAAQGGWVVELRGDEALAVFGSARQAVRAAIDLQARVAKEESGVAGTRIEVGVGLDAGEAVPVEGGYRGGALNLAARLCSLAAAGEILASEAVVHLARKVDGVAYRERGPVDLKGIAHPVRIVQVVPGG